MGAVIDIIDSNTDELPHLGEPTEGGEDTRRLLVEHDVLRHEGGDVREASANVVSSISARAEVRALGPAETKALADEAIKDRFTWWGAEGGTSFSSKAWTSVERKEDKGIWTVRRGLFVPCMGEEVGIGASFIMVKKGHAVSSQVKR